MVETSGFSNQGGRDCNEDCYKIIKHNNNICEMVADGLGWHGGGSIASATAIDTISQCLEEHPLSDKITKFDINIWFNMANEAVMSRQTPTCKMKTTLSLICFEPGSDKVLAAHLGDTRIYHFVGDKLSYMSFDHSVSRMAVLAGEISMEQVRFHCDRNKLLKVVGNDDGVSPEIIELILDRSVRNVFLICTDGFWEYVTEDVMERTLRNSDSPEEWLKLMQEQLEKNIKEGNDNNTAVAMFINQ